MPETKRVEKTFSLEQLLSTIHKSGKFEGKELGVRPFYDGKVIYVSNYTAFYHTVKALNERAETRTYAGLGIPRVLVYFYRDGIKVCSHQSMTEGIPNP